MMSNTNRLKIAGHISNLTRIRNSLSAITSLPMDLVEDLACHNASRAIAAAIEELQLIVDHKPVVKKEEVQP